MVIVYILDCIRIGTKPCKYFQLNSAVFDRNLGIFSKLAIDAAIPDQWRLAQRYHDGEYRPTRWPVFVKPEWGQNAAGVERADNPDALAAIRKRIQGSGINYLIQQGAPESREFEVFSMRSHKHQSEFALLTVTEVVNTGEPNPVNSIYNTNTRYVEITDKFDHHSQQLLWHYVNRMGYFNISRAGLRANSIAELIAGRFHVIEVNLFLPMPINMLDRRYSRIDTFKLVTRYMMCLARLTAARDKSLVEKPVFTKIMMYHRKNRIINFIRARI